jgi:nitrite reductase (NO-forming)
MKNRILAFIGLAFLSMLTLSITSFSNSPAPGFSENPTLQEAADLNSPMMKGKAIYEGKGLCHVCHQISGEGLPPAFPPLANADYLLEDKYRAIRQAMYGSKEPITVNGVTYPGGVMTVVELTDEEVMNVVNYILNSWGNDGGTVTLEEVKAQRK